MKFALGVLLLLTAEIAVADELASGIAETLPVAGKLAVLVSASIVIQLAFRAAAEAFLAISRGLEWFADKTETQVDNKAARATAAVADGLARVAALIARVHAIFGVGYPKELVLARAHKLEAQSDGQRSPEGK